MPTLTFDDETRDGHVSTRLALKISRFILSWRDSILIFAYWDILLSSRLLSRVSGGTGGQNGVLLQYRWALRALFLDDSATKRWNIFENLLSSIKSSDELPNWESSGEAAIGIAHGIVSWRIYEVKSGWRARFIAWELSNSKIRACTVDTVHWRSERRVDGFKMTLARCGAS